MRLHMQGRSGDPSFERLRYWREVKLPDNILTGLPKLVS